MKQGKSYIKYVIKLRILNHKSLYKREVRMSERRCENRSRGHGEAIAMWKAMAPHSSTFAWKIPWTEEPGRLHEAGRYLVGITKSQTQLSDFTFMNWRRKWQPTPVFLPGVSQG